MSKTITQQYKEKDGTYLVTFTETERRKLTTEDELVPILAQMARDAQETVRQTGHLTLGFKDAYLLFAKRFLNYLKDDPKLFADFLEEVQSWPREAQNPKEAK